MAEWARKKEEKQQKPMLLKYKCNKGIKAIKVRA